jgi:Ca2+-binding RTX toxin-like protein
VRFDPVTRVATPFTSPGVERPKGIAIGPDREIWFGTLGDAGNGSDSRIGHLETVSRCAGQPIDVYLALGEAPTAGDDVVLGTPLRDQVASGGGADRVCGGGSRDVLDGGPGSDVLRGGPGPDTLRGRSGDDTLVGSAPADQLSGGLQTDTCRGGPQTDTTASCEVRSGIP